MKLLRHIYLILLLPLLPGCGKDPLPDVGDRPIGFASAVSVETKTTYRYKPDDPSILISQGNQISLYGVRTVPDELDPTTTITNDVFDHSNMSLECMRISDPATGLPVWEYTPLAYWKQTGHYYFAGIFPYNHDITIEEVYYLRIPYYASNNKDVMVARANRDVEVDPEGTDPVPLQFRHACSAVRILFANSATAGSYKLTSYKMEGISLSGSLKVSSQLPNNPAILSSEWTASPVRGDLCSWEVETWPDGADDRITVASPSDPDDPDQYTSSGWYYMVPQTLASTSAIRFSVTYGSNTTPVTTLISITDCDGETGADTWEPNMVYNYYITLSQSGLTLTVKTTQWDEVQVSTDVITFEP